MAVDASSPPREQVAALSRPCTLPAHVTLPGTYVELQPWQASHADALFPHISGPDNAHVHDFLMWEPPADAAALAHEVKMEPGAETPTMLVWTVFERGAAGRCLGMVALDNIRPAQRVIESGLLYAPALQRTVAATEAWYLVARAAMECGFRRLEWKCDSRNARSWAAALRYGHEFEGIFRQHHVVRGLNRDTAWFSILDREWPVRKLALERWMSPDNFDAEGKQKLDLVSIRKHMLGQSADGETAPPPS